VKHYIALGLLALGLAGCKQGIGERCQINADCATNHCSMSDPQVCVTNEGNNLGDIDAMVPPQMDAAAPTDAAPDAAPDAPP
jgi:hypothetical protein